MYLIWCQFGRMALHAKGKYHSYPGTPYRADSTPQKSAYRGAKPQEFKIYLAQTMANIWYQFYPSAPFLTLILCT